MTICTQLLTKINWQSLGPDDHCRIGVNTSCNGRSDLQLVGRLLHLPCSAYCLRIQTMLKRSCPTPLAATRWAAATCNPMRRAAVTRSILPVQQRTSTIHVPLLSEISNVVVGRKCRPCFFSMIQYLATRSQVSHVELDLVGSCCIIDHVSLL